MARTYTLRVRIHRTSEAEKPARSRDRDLQTRETREHSYYRLPTTTTALTQEAAMGKGALVFKGDKPKSKSKKSKKSSKKSKHGGGGGDEGGHERRPVASPSATAAAAAQHAGSTSTSAAATHASSSVAVAPPQPQIEEGIGRITASGTVLTGHGTQLKKQGIRAGDAILVNVDGKEEMRVLTMVLSEGSASLSTPFGISLKTPTAFQYIQKPRDVVKERADKARKIRITKEEEARSAFGTYGSGADSGSGAATEFVYREVTEHGSYRIRKEKVDGDVSRGDLLTMRTKKKSDKYC